MTFSIGEKLDLRKNVSTIDKISLLAFELDATNQLPSGYVNSLLLKMAINVDFPIKNGGSFHSYVSLPEGISMFFFGPRSRSPGGQAPLRQSQDVPGRPGVPVIFVVERKSHSKSQGD